MCFLFWGKKNSDVIGKERMPFSLHKTHASEISGHDASLLFF
jgi:hypothetical protein